MENISLMTVSACISIFVTIWALNRDNKKDTKEDTETTVTVREEIKYISRGVEDIKYDTRSLTTTINGLNDRLIRVEESVKNAHDKIDKMKSGDGV